MLTRARLLAALTAICATALIAACGGDDAPSNLSTPVPANTVVAAASSLPPATLQAPAAPPTPASPPSAPATTSGPSCTGSLASVQRTGKRTFPAAPQRIIDPNKTYTAPIKTNKGDITVELAAKDAPITVNNFVFLAATASTTA